jgi:hypothetical protein
MEKEESLYPTNYYYSPNSSSYNKPSSSYEAPEITNNPEIPGYHQITNLKLNGGTNSVTVKSGQAVSIGFKYSVWTRTGCPGCIVQIILGVGENALNCFYNGSPGAYPGKSGNYSTTINAPKNYGTYYLYTSYATQYNCSDAMELYLPITASKIGTIIVSP